MSAERKRHALGLIAFACFGLGVAVFLLGRVGTNLTPQGKKYHLQAGTITALELSIDEATQGFVAQYSPFVARLHPLVAYLQPNWREISNRFAVDGAATSASDPISHLDARGTNAYPLPGTAAAPASRSSAVTPLQPDLPY
jgi:hypothetical protein